MRSKHSNRKIYIVCSEVIATSLEEAAKKKGRVYSVSLANEETQNQLIKLNPLGYKTKK